MMATPAPVKEQTSKNKKAEQSTTTNDKAAVDYVKRIAEQHATCTGRGCHIRSCDVELLKQATYSTQLHDYNTKSDILIHDLIRGCEDKKSKPRDLYSTNDESKRTNAFLHQIGSTRVCQDCYCTFFATPLSTMKQLKLRVQRGDTHYIDGRKVNHGRNQYHNADTSESAEIGLAAYIAHAKNNVAQKAKIDKKIKYLLPNTLTKEKFYSLYKQFCVENFYHTFSRGRVIKHCITDHKDLVFAKIKPIGKKRPNEEGNGNVDADLVSKFVRVDGIPPLGAQPQPASLY